MAHEAEGDPEQGTPEFESEEAGASSGPTKPWDPAQIRVSTKNFSLRQVIDEIKDGTIDLAPDFQRDYVWKALQKTRLIESILLGIPLPAFYFDAATDGSYKVVDGVQRLSTIRDFAGGLFKLTEDLEYLTDLSDRRFGELGAPLVRRFHTTQIVVHVIEPTSPLELKYDIFKRLNTGGTPLTPQEIRHCMSKPRSRQFLGRLVRLPSFRSATNLKPAKRMEDQELALRFTAFFRLVRTGRNIYEKYAAHETLDGFLLQTMADLDNPSKVGDEELNVIEQSFDRAMKNATLVFKSHAFRKWTSDDARGPLNRALFETWSVALAGIDEAQAQACGAKIREKVKKKLAEEPDYSASVTVGTGKLTQVKTRFEAAFGIIQESIR
jgi:hypothetical protein